MTTWNGSGSFWAAHDDRFDAMLAPLTGHLFAAADLAPADRVLDVGCGCGATSRTAAGTAASVVGVDIDEQMIARARERSAGIANLRYEVANAAATPFEPVDVVLSRLGVMFFEDPVAGFTNLRRVGGRLVFLCWQGMAKNDGRLTKYEALSPYLNLPALTRPKGAMSLAEPSVVRETLGAAGYVDVELTGVEELLWQGSSADDAVEFQLSDPAWAKLLAEAGPEATAAATESLRAAYTARETSEGVLLGGAAWVVTAR